MTIYHNYNEWRHATTVLGGLTLNRDYCTARILALTNDDNPSTKSLIRAYGRVHQNQLVRWFQQAMIE